MNKSIKWLLVVPAAVLAIVATWVALTLAWNLVSLINIVPQNDLISLGLAGFGINAIAPYAGIVVSSRLAPTSQQLTAVVLAVILIGFAIATLAFGLQFRILTSMSFGWHLWSTFAWVVGSIAAAVHAK